MDRYENAHDQIENDDLIPDHLKEKYHRDIERERFEYYEECHDYLNG